jgi:hypothetical protein
MRKLTFLISIVLFSALITSCGKEHSNPGTDPTDTTGVVTDADATNFINAAKITDTVQKQAIQSLVKDLKDSSLWGKLMAIYPFVGGNEASTKMNLKDPRDLDEAFRITYHGAPVIAATGVLFPTTSDYADTHLYDSLMTYNDNSISFFSRTQNTVSGYDMGCSDWFAPYNQLTIYHESNGSAYFGLSIWGPTPANTKGLFMFSSTPSKVSSFENGILKYETDTVPVNKFTNYPMLIGWCQNAEAVGKRECAFSSIGKGLSEAEALTFYNIVNKFQNALKR